MAATQALREIIAEGVEPDEIEQIEAFVLPPHLKMIDHGVRPGDRASRLTSLPYQIAVVAMQPAMAFDVGQTAADAEALQPLMTRVAVQADAALLADYPRRWPARVVVHTRAGVKERQISDVPGDPARPMTKQQIRGKFIGLAEPVLGKAAHHNYEAALTRPWPDILSIVRRGVWQMGTCPSH